jgi:imidazolonepropionase-like amidohydrolase
MNIVIVNIGELVTLAGAARARVGAELRELGILRNAGMLIEDGRVVAVGPDAEIRARIPADARVIDAEGRCVTPGFVDAHTHLVFAGNRADEFEKRIAGATYQEIAAAGGGILRTVRLTREASEDELLSCARRNRDWMLRGGMTTMEAKSGYGLDRETELRILRVIARLSQEGPARIVPTLLAAHTVPPEFADSASQQVSESASQREHGPKESRGSSEFNGDVSAGSSRVGAQGAMAGWQVGPESRGIAPIARKNRAMDGARDWGGRDEYVRWIAEELIPEVARERLARYCDAFCDDHAFTVEETRTVLTSAKRHGLGLRVHAEQFRPGTGAALAAELGAATADHLETVTDETLAQLREAGVQPVLLPASVFALSRTQYPPARRMVEMGLAIVLATDFNPGSSPVPSMPFVLSLACLQMGLTPAEAFTAATINAAFSLGMGDQIGSLESGKQADFIIHEFHDYRELAYFIAAPARPRVFIAGREVVQ